ncbi:hypothetical protein TorRG33x02_099630 [Trema orientale]|uniref:Uncharacterized protein n=1 Tax=Trema orientale TaxID=63057 RepID=A0A2P5F8V9_TREOI|nr:hypothetical protein TorRG33x02_099630 [Trema orientale]
MSVKYFLEALISQISIDHKFEVYGQWFDKFILPIFGVANIIYQFASRQPIDNCDEKAAGDFPLDVPQPNRMSSTECEATSKITVVSFFNSEPNSSISRG